MLHDHAVGVMESSGAVVTPIDLNALDLPLYNPELETEAFPSNAQTFKDTLMQAGKCMNGHVPIFRD
jgi:NAD(P)H-dependent FMN reductase